MKFNLEDYKNGPYAMHCATEEEAKSFLNILHKAGRRWVSGLDYNKITQWTNYKEETIYYFNRGTYGTRNQAKSYCNNVIILEWSDFKNNSFTKSDLRNGDVILKRRGAVEIVCLELGCLICQNGVNRLSDINEDLTSKIGKEYDIVEVRRPESCNDCHFRAFNFEVGKLVYSRKKEETIEEMTMEEICKALGKNIKIVKEKK